MAVLVTAGLLALTVPVAPVVAADFPAAMIDDPACATFSGACFDPDPITIMENDTVTWANNSALAHTATADDLSWDTGQLDPGMSGTITFLTAGIFPYHCTFHADMVGTVEVVAVPSAGQSRPTT